MFRFLLLLFFFFVPASSFSQTWELKNNEDGIKIFTRLVPGNDIEDVRCSFNIRTNLSSFVALLKDIKGYPEWAFNCLETKLLEAINDSVLIYYQNTYLPWPVNDRDFVLRQSIKQDPITQIVKTSVSCIPGYVKVKEDVVRLTSGNTSWNLTPKPGGFISVDYIASVGQGGSLPAWLVNSTIEYGPLQSMQKIRKLLEGGKYKNAQFWFIKELLE